MGRTFRRQCHWLARNPSFFYTCVLLGFLLTGLYILRGEDFSNFQIEAFEQYDSAGNKRGATDEKPPMKLPPSISLGNISQVSRRHKLVQERCQKLEARTAQRVPAFRWSPIISTIHQPNLFYCPLAKAGSTFFTRYIVAIETPGIMKSPLDIKIEAAKRTNLQSFDSLRYQSRKKEFLEHSFKFVFGRNPYSRIFSAYIDKLYSPNPFYWKEWGIPALAGQDLSHNGRCGNGASFPQFVKLVVSSLHKTDMHFMPMVNICKICEVNWDMVGWVEQSLTDIDFLSWRIGVNSSFQHRSEYKMATAMDVIYDSTTDSMTHWTDQIRNCMSLHDMGRIIWRRLQIRGIIYNDIPFPFSDIQMESVTVERFQLECRNAAEKSVDRSRLKRQKEDAFREAYNLIDGRDLTRIQEIYKTDFYVFGYDPQPSSIFTDAVETRTEKILDWNRVWD